MGLQHNLAMSMPDAPVDLTLDRALAIPGNREHPHRQHLVRRCHVERAFGDKHLGVIPFGGIAWERSTIDAEYDYVVELPTGSTTRKATFSIDGDDAAHYTLGLAVQFFHVNLAGDYNFGEYDSFSGGLMIVL